MSQVLGKLLTVYEGLGLEDQIQYPPRRLPLTDLARLALAAERAFSIPLPDHALWEYESVSHMARDIESRLADKSEDAQSAQEGRDAWYYQ